MPHMSNSTRWYVFDGLFSCCLCRLELGAGRSFHLQQTSPWILWWRYTSGNNKMCGALFSSGREALRWCAVDPCTTCMWSAVWLVNTDSL
uniref:Uncharacterized protein n=1 Tax=Aegilops tauschii subsp. strangulata TaxID=200361 RepID=A0A453H4B1_AEGTS